MPWLLIDFDSTLVTVESLELLAEYALADAGGDENGAARLAAIRALTRHAMAGRMPFQQALAERFAILRPRAAQIPPLVEALRAHVSPSFRRHAGFLRERAQAIYVVSAGFHECAAPIAAEFGIAPGHVLANRFVTRPNGTLGFDATNPLCRDGGKIAAVRALGLQGPAVAIGDGISDLELGSSDLCETFICYTETVERPEVSRHAPHRAGDFDAVLDYLRERESRT